MNQIVPLQKEQQNLPKDWQFQEPHKNLNQNSSHPRCCQEIYHNQSFFCKFPLNSTQESPIHTKPTLKIRTLKQKNQKKRTTFDIGSEIKFLAGMAKINLLHSLVNHAFSSKETHFNSPHFSLSLSP